MPEVAAPNESGCPPAPADLPAYRQLRGPARPPPARRCGGRRRRPANSRMQGRVIRHRAQDPEPRKFRMQVSACRSIHTSYARIGRSAVALDADGATKPLRAPRSAQRRARGLADEMPVPQRTQVCVCRREPARAWLLHAYRGSVGAEAVVTALVLAAPRTSASAPRISRTPSGGERRARCGETQSGRRVGSRALDSRLGSTGRCTTPDVSDRVIPSGRCRAVCQV